VIPDLTRIYMPALDFVRALNERLAIIKFLCRWFFGRYAYREFLFIVKIIEEQGHGAFREYGCEKCEYQDDPMPLIWWRKKEETP